MGANNPKMVPEFPLTGVTPVFKPALKTKSFITKGGMWLKLGDSVDTLGAVRQCPSMNITINNNLERTPALGEDESIENSLGDFDVSGSLDVYNVDLLGQQIYNDATEGKDKVIQVRVSRKVGSVTTSYTLTLNVHLGAPTKSRNGKKFQFSVPFTVNDDKDLSLVKDVSDDTPAPSPVDADTPAVTALVSAEYELNAEAAALDGTATVTDGGTVSYQWYTVEDGTDTAIDGETSATFTPPTDTVGAFTYKVVATNTNAAATGATTATASSSAVITVTGE